MITLSAASYPRHDMICLLFYELSIIGKISTIEINRICMGLGEFVKGDEANMYRPEAKIIVG